MRKEERICPPLILPLSMASVMNVRPMELSSFVVFLYEHQPASISMLSISAPHFDV